MKYMGLSFTEQVCTIHYATTVSHLCIMIDAAFTKGTLCDCIHSALEMIEGMVKKMCRELASTNIPGIEVYVSDLKCIKWEP